MYNKLQFNSITTSTWERHRVEDRAEKERYLPFTRKQLGQQAFWTMTPPTRVPVPTPKQRNRAGC